MFELLLASCISLALLAVGCSDSGSVSSSVETEHEAAMAGGRLTTDDIFANVVPEIFERTWDDFEVRGAAPVIGERFTTFLYTHRGPKMWAYCNRELVDPCDCDCTQGVDPCIDPSSQTILREARQTVQIFLPNTVDFQQPPVLYIDKAGNHDGETESEKEALGKLLARKGVITAIWTEQDLFPLGAEPLPRIAEQFGFAGPASFQRDGCKHWLRTRDPLNLTVEDLRIDDRYHNSQSYVLTGTFFQALVDDWFAGDPDANAWASNVQIVYAGGSKAAAGAYTASGIDARCVALRTSGFLEFDTGPRAAAHRFETDWRECPINCPSDDTCDAYPAGAHRWYRYTNWLRDNKDNLPSYWDTYRLGRNRERYEHLLFLEIAGTHDWINPLGSEEAFWASVDGLNGGLVDPTEDRWNFRFVRRINADHGTSYTVGRTAGGKDVRGDQLLLFRALMHLAKGKAMPRIELASMDVSGDPSTEPWSVRVRLTDLPAEHDPFVEEQFKIHIAFSDDRDFRRCSDPIVCSGNESCAENGVCRDPSFDDNRPEEDFFIKIRDYETFVDGEFRDLVFDAPVEALAFTNPLVAAIVEVRLDDRIPYNIKDDWVLHTEVLYANEEHYPEVFCCSE